MPAADGDGELPEALQKLDPHIVELVCNEVVDRGAGVAWEDIAGQEAAKKLVQELVVWPMLNPHLFKVQPLETHLSCQGLPGLARNTDFRTALHGPMHTPYG